jgi:hypothetical protein
MDLKLRHTGKGPNREGKRKWGKKEKGKEKEEGAEEKRKKEREKKYGRWWEREIGRSRVIEIAKE